MKYENQILDAIETIVDKRVGTAKYDKTIQATVLTVENAATGKYKVQYQDSVFYAYSISTEINYNAGSKVYILVPENDMSRNKTILGSVNGLGQTYISTPTTIDSFETIGNNCIMNDQKFGLCSYHPNREYLLYDKESGIDLLDLNQTSVDTYVKSATSIMLSMTVSTQLVIEQRSGGIYGIAYELAFMNNSTEDIILKEYSLNVNHFEGNPYQIKNPTKQQIVFDIDTNNFLYINKVYLYCYNFPNETVAPCENDIFIEDLEFFASKPLDTIDLESYSLSLNTPQGIYFNEGDPENTTKLIEAQIKVKGKDLGQEAQNLAYYWFVEDNSVTTASDDYYSYGGQGWKCLNEKATMVDELTNTSVIRWVPGGLQYTIKKKDCNAKETKYKCVVIYNNIVLNKTLTIINYGSLFNITIVSDQGTEFYYDIGDPTLTCIATMNNEIIDPSLCNYQWVVVDNNNNFTTLTNTISENNRYNTAMENYTRLLQQIEEEDAYAIASQSLLDEYLAIINQCNSITRIENNYIHHLQINSINNYSTYKCSVSYYNQQSEIYIGTASITISNDLTKNQGYSLVINNGSQLFKYGVDGIAPTSKSLNKAQTITPLSCVMYNSLGQVINENVMNNCTIEWMFPAENSLLILPDKYEYDIIENYKVIKDKNLSQITYEIQDKYNINNTNNNIKLKVKYKDMILVAETDFVFSKEGDLSINGTNIVCKITPNFESNNSDNDEKRKDINFLPMVLNGELNFTRPENEQNKWFLIDLWKDSTRIYHSYDSGSSLDGKDVIIKWEILKNSYDNSDISVTENGSFSYIHYHAEGTSPANIIKATILYDNITYYAMLPLITASTASEYIVSLNELSGFNKVIYNINKNDPQYDDTQPFELTVMKNINNYWENISLLTKDQSVNYEWQIKGTKYNISTHTSTSEQYFSINTIGLKRNQVNCIPINTYNGNCVNIGLECKLTNKDNETVGFIHIPIHFYLDYIEKNEIEKWNGNFLYLNQNNYDMMLAPQMGIGEYNEEDDFSGIFTGDIKQGIDDTIQKGFFNYSNGIKTFFLNAKTGSVLIGKDGYGQILIDPIENQTLLYSHNYWKNYLSNGMPTSYGNENLNSQGILIDLNNAEIKHGNGKFLLNSNGFSGKINASDGSLGGFQIKSNEITNSTGTVHLQSTGRLYGPNWSIAASGETTFDNIRITSNGVSGATTKIIDIGSGDFSVQKDGYTVINNGNITGEITANKDNLTIIDNGTTYTIENYIKKIIQEEQSEE